MTHVEAEMGCQKGRTWLCKPRPDRRKEDVDGFPRNRNHGGYDDGLMTKDESDGGRGSRVRNGGTTGS